MIRKLALVEKVYLEYQERHILTVNCLVSYEDFGSQNIMNIVLDTWDKEKHQRFLPDRETGIGWKYGSSRVTSVARAS